MKLDFLTVAVTVVCMFTVLFIGFSARKLGLLQEMDGKRLSNLVLHVAQPFMLICALMGQDFSTENLLTGAKVFGLGILAHGVMAGIAFLSTLWIAPLRIRKITEFAIVFGNCGFFGFPLIEACLGAKGLFLAAFWVFSYNIVVWTYGIFLLSRANPSMHLSLRKALVNFGTVPSMIGLLLYISKGFLPATFWSYPLTAAVLRGMQYIEGICTPIAMLIIGIMLAAVPYRKLFTGLRVYFVLAVRLLLLPVTAATVAFLLGLQTELIIFLSIICAVPSGTNTVMFAETYDLHADYAAHAVGMSTALSTLTIPLISLYVNFLLSL